MEDQAEAAGTADPARLQAEIEAARAEIAQLAHEAADEAVRARAAEEEGDRLRVELAAANDAVATFEADASSLRDLLGASEERARDAASRYRDLVLHSEPSLPPDLIAGDTIEAVDASAVAARAMVGRVRSHVEAESQAARVPAGAPQRSSVDLSAMTAEQKIRYGLSQRQAP